MSEITNNPFMAEAIELSVKNVAEGGGPFAAVIVRDGEIVARGTNRVTSSNDPTAHAEIVAIRAAAAALQTFELRGCEIYSSCEPCPMCMGAIYWARLDALYFAATRDDAAAAGFDDSLIYTEIALPPTQRSIPIRQQMRDEAIRAFAAWNASLQKIRY